MRNYSIHNTIWKNKGHELDELANAMLNKNLKYVLIGNKEEIDEFEKRTNHEIDISKRIVDEEQMDDELNNDTHVVCLYKNRMKYERCREKCKNVGIYENKRFFQGEVFQMIFDVYKKNEIKLDRIEIFMTSMCTLNCEKCISYIPYFKHRVIAPLDTLKKDIDLLFSKVDYVYKLKLLGGEGFLYPYLIEYVDYIYQNYHNKIESIRIGTNGTIIPKEDLVQMCLRDEVTVDISDYSQAVPELSKLDLVRETLEQKGVSVDIKRTGEQWLDMGFPQNIPRERTQESISKQYEKCAMFCRQFSEGKLFFCCSNCAAIKAELYDINENDYFDFQKDFTKKELLEYELGFCNLGYTNFCALCRGGSDEANPYHIEVAKQVARTKEN